MADFIFNRVSKSKQYAISIFLILLVASISYSFSSLIDYKVVAFLLLVTVSSIAMFFDIRPVLTAAILSALIWNFFFIHPKLTLSISRTEDILLFFTYFIIAMVNAALTYKIKKIQKEANKRESEENALKLYNTLLNSLSHELRTPISTIIGATDNLLHDNNKLSEKNKTELVEEISKASLRLNRQVGNLLNMSRLESGVIQAKKDWCDVNELVHDVINSLKDNLQNRIVNIHIKENLPLVKLDYGLMEQVLYNLIQNAALYIPKNSVISVRAHCSQDKLILEVEDTGNGFPEDEIKKVFDKFYRLKNSTPGGTGLGLSVVKGFVEAQGGTIHLSNIPERGAKFTIEIPTETSSISYIKHE